MKRNYFILIIFITFSIFAQTSYGEKITITEIKTKENIELSNKKELNREEIFNFFGNSFSGAIPESYKYIKLNYLDVKPNTKLYESLQKLVYLDLIKNTKTKINKQKNLDLYSFYKIAEKIFGFKLDNIVKNPELTKKFATQDDISAVIDYEDFSKRKEKISLEESQNSKVQEKKYIFSNVYKTLLEEHYDKDKIDEVKFMEGAIEGLTNSVGDKFTVYFPPTETKDFYESLNGEFEGIGAYVDMETPGVFKIISPVVGSPAEKAGVKGGDIVLKVDGKEITKENSLKEVISWVKGKAGTKVILTISRDDKIFDIEVERAKIVINDVEYKNLSDDTFYIQIKSFGDKASIDFKKSLEELKTKNNVKKLIIDLRNDGGGYLEQVGEMLSYFVPLNEPTTVVKYLNGEDTNYSNGYDLIDFSKYKIIILENSGTASASEIMIGTLKDYYKDLIIIGEKSYGKGSVQTIKSYSDGSSLKYTIARWFTGKTKTGIDKIGIEPTIKLELNTEDFKKGIDNQLEKAKSIN